LQVLHVFRGRERFRQEAAQNANEVATAKRLLEMLGRDGYGGAEPWEEIARGIAASCAESERRRG